MLVDNVNTSQASSGSGVMPDTARGLHNGTTMWPADTDVIFSGTHKVTLNLQLPLMREIILDAFENVRVSLLFTDAFPDAVAALAVVRVGLVAAATERVPRASDIYKRLLCDADYMAKMIRLVSRIILVKMLLTRRQCLQPRARISLIRAEVKERCTAIIRTDFLALGSAQKIAQVVEKQLLDYKYTFPAVGNVRITFSANIS